jgi:hypothetical protein
LENGSISRSQKFLYRSLKGYWKEITLRDVYLQCGSKSNVAAADRPQDGEWICDSMKEARKLAILGLNFRHPGRSGLTDWRLVIKHRRDAGIATPYVPAKTPFTGMSSIVECE